MRETIAAGVERGSDIPGDSGMLSGLARAAPEVRKAAALSPDLGAVGVIRSRTGLGMLPMRDTVQGGDFDLGDVLVAGAHVRAAGGDGYGMTVGRDLERAMAMALPDAGGLADVARGRVTAFAARRAAAQTQTDSDTLSRVNPTRVEAQTL
ncbi:hypothetical protein C357_13447 [Citreicella sp. 357]|nr:hypothetical protein C357_13447 [Citreicella sp. 357]